MAMNYFLKFDGVMGEVSMELPEPLSRPIRLYSWNWRAYSLSSVSSGGGSGAGKVTLEDFTFITQLDRSTPQFFRRIYRGAHIESASLWGKKAGHLEWPWLEMEFKRLFITNIQNEGQPFDELPMVNVAFSFEEVTIDYSVQRSDGNLISTGPITYNRKENKLS